MNPILLRLIDYLNYSCYGKKRLAAFSLRRPMQPFTPILLRAWSYYYYPDKPMLTKRRSNQYAIEKQKNKRKANGTLQRCSVARVSRGYPIHEENSNASKGCGILAFASNMVGATNPGAELELIILRREQKQVSECVARRRKQLDVNAAFRRSGNTPESDPSQDRIAAETDPDGRSGRALGC